MFFLWKNAMRLLFILVIATLTVGLQEQPGSDNSDLIVTKFTWTKHEQKGIPRPQDFPERPVPRTVQQARIETTIIEGRTRNPVNAGPDYYILHLELKNAGPNVVQSFVWEYRPTASTPDYEPRQYVCTVNAKPKEKKTLDIVSPFAPLKVVSASETKTKKDGEVLVNQIEYGDGSLWKRKGWSIIVPSEFTRTIAAGTCMAF